MFDRADDTNNFAQSGRSAAGSSAGTGVVNADAFADGILPRPELAGRLRVDDHHRRRIALVVISEQPSSD